MSLRCHHWPPFQEDSIIYLLIYIVYCCVLFHSPSTILTGALMLNRDATFLWRLFIGHQSLSLPNQFLQELDLVSVGSELALTRLLSHVPTWRVCPLRRLYAKFSDISNFRKHLSLSDYILMLGLFVSLYQTNAVKWKVISLPLHFVYMSSCVSILEELCFFLFPPFFTICIKTTIDSCWFVDRP